MYVVREISKIGLLVGFIYFLSALGPPNFLPTIVEDSH